MPDAGHPHHGDDRHLEKRPRPRRVSYQGCGLPSHDRVAAARPVEEWLGALPPAALAPGLIASIFARESVIDLIAPDSTSLRNYRSKLLSGRIVSMGQASAGQTGGLSPGTCAF